MVGTYNVAERFFAPKGDLMRKPRLREMTDHQLTREWLNETTHLLARRDGDTDQYLVTMLRAIRELNRRSRASHGVMGWCVCEDCFRWCNADTDDFLIENLVTKPELFE